MEQPSGESPKMTTVSYAAEFSPEISRLFIFRGLTMLVEIWVMYVWMFWISLNHFAQFFIMLFTGTRNEGIWKRQLRFMRHLAKWQAYLMTLTDQRPKWIED